MARFGGLVSVFWGVSGGMPSGGFGPPAVKGAKARGDFQGRGIGLWLVGLAGSGSLMVTLAKGGLVLSTKKRTRSTTPIVEGTTKGAVGGVVFEASVLEGFLTSFGPLAYRDQARGWLVSLVLPSNRSGDDELVGAACKFSFICTLFYLAFVVFCLLFCAIFRWVFPAGRSKPSWFNLVLFGNFLLSSSVRIVLCF